jgi:hypothetical protein
MLTLALSLELRLLRIKGDTSLNLLPITSPNRQLRRRQYSREGLRTPRKLSFLVINIIQSMPQNLAGLLPIGKSDILQSSVDIKPKVIVFAIANMSVFDPVGNSVRLACHLLECTQNGTSAVFDLDYVAETGAYAEDEDFGGFGEEASYLLDQDFAWVVVPEAGVDEFDIVSSAFDGFEEGGGCGCGPCDLPDSAVCERGAVVVGLK